VVIADGASGELVLAEVTMAELQGHAGDFHFTC
jgi:hypothetical protein